MQIRANTLRNLHIAAAIQILKEKNMKHKIIVLSADALVADDMEKLSEMPNFKKYLADGSCIRKVKSIYPTITYPCHTTISTGVYPDRHGIPGNLKSPYKYIKSPIPWIWEREYVKVPDIFDAAKKAGQLSTVLWSVSATTLSSFR